MTLIKRLPVFLGLLVLWPLCNHAQFLDEQAEYARFSTGEYVDVYYEFTKPQTSAGGSDKRGKVVRDNWDVAESARKRIVCESHLYQGIASLERPAVEEILVGGVNLLAGKGIYILAEDKEGSIYTSLLSPVKARQNTWRAGYYYYDAHLLDFQLASASGDTLPLFGEIILHAYPDKLHVEVRLKPGAGTESVAGPELVRASLVCEMKGKAKKSGPGWMVGSDGQELGILGGISSGKTISVDIDLGPESGKTPGAWLVFFPGRNDIRLATLLEEEANPLGKDAFTIRDGLFLGYDAACGFYHVKNIHGQMAAGRFESFYKNPNVYLSTGIRIQNDSRPRKIYIKQSSDAGPIESALLTDTTGFPLPIPIESAKNFPSEKEEPDDSPFSESYFPISLAASETTAFNVLHLHMNWGGHTLRQVSAVRYFQIYYHLSQGVTETTCFSLPTKFQSIPSGEARAYALADYRPLSGQMWTQQPQHDHVALQGWLQYEDAGGNWRYPVYKGSRIYSAGPNMAWFTMDYTSSDGLVDQHLEILEMPQDDESRSFVRLRYTFLDDVEIGGEVSRNFRLLNSGSYIRKVHFKELAWTGADGEVRTHPIENNGEWAISGEEIRPYNSFACGYPHPDGNASMVFRRIAGKVNGEVFSRAGFSAIAHEDGKTELMLVPIIEGNTIRKGSVIEVDCILMPYGDDRSEWTAPYEESVRYGLNEEEFQILQASSGLPSDESPLLGPTMEVLHGEKVMDLPPYVRVEDNYASVKFLGGHDGISLVASGFSHSKYPMLWERNAFLDPQVKGHDGIQAFQNKDGTYGFVFNPRVRTTRRSGRWGTRAHTYHITQAISEQGIREVSTLNGRVRIEQYVEGNLNLVSPVIWCPALNEPLDGDLNSTASSALAIEAVPLQLSGFSRPEKLGVDEYSPSRIVLQVTAKEDFRIRMEGLYPDSTYSIERNGKTTEKNSDKNGRLELEIEASDNAAEVVIHNEGTQLAPGF